MQPELAAIIRAIDRWRDKSVPLPLGSVVPVRATDTPRFAGDEVADSPRSPFVRHLLAAIGGDEHRLFRWRLEHKLVQALVVGHYAPGATPRSCGLAAFASACGRAELRRALRRAFRAGYIIKRALSDCTGELGTNNVAREALAAVEARKVRCDGSVRPADERWLVQERIRIAREYRVHSFDRYVIGDLTFHRYRADANVAGGTADFVQSILDRLPEGIVNRSFFAWDVARDLDGRRVVIEVNLTGMHPVFRPGFQTSGHLQHDTTGAWAAAMLVRHIERCLGISIEVDGDAVLPDEFAKAALMYREVRRHL